jgi:nicotinate dehydrogenase subunit B
LTPIDPTTLDRIALLALDDSLIVHEAGEAPMAFVLVDGGGRVYGFNGHVDLGTGVRTALAQIVAEELYLRLDQVTMVLGDTARTPDQGATIASDTLQTSAKPLRAAAAQACALLVQQAARRLNVAEDQVGLNEGDAVCNADGRRLSFAELVQGERLRRVVDLCAPVKPASAYTVVGASLGRVDIPKKAAGELVFVHDMRLPGMLHGRVVRPPYAGVDAGDFVGKSLIGVDETSIAHIVGGVRVVTQGDFVGVVAEREEQAVAAAEALVVHWRPAPSVTDLSDIAKALSAHPSEPRRLQDKGDVEAALDGADTRLTRQYVWPYQMHGAIGPSCALADYRRDGLRVWSGTQNPHLLRADLALLTGLAIEQIEVVRMETSGCYGRNCADDVTADAALLSKAVGAPVRVQLSRQQEHLWEPKGAGQLMQVDGALNEAGEPVAYDFQTRYPSNGAPTLALLLTGVKTATPEVWLMGDRTSVAPYDLPNMRVTVHDMAPIVRASWLRGVSALPNSFAHESWIDEAAAMAGVDPIEYRLRYLHDPRGVAVVEATAERAGWSPHVAPRRPAAEDGVLKGRGFAYALYVHSKFPGYGAAWAAWVADVSVDTTTGEVSVTKVTVGHDAGLMVNPAGVQHQIHGNVIQSTSRALKERVTFDAGGVVPAEWGGYPILTLPEVPEIDVVMVPRPDQPPLGVGESASAPSAAAIANAIFDATGVRLREPPFTPEKVRAALATAGLLTPPDPSPEVQPPSYAPGPRRRRAWAPAATIASCLIGLAGLIGALVPFRAAIPPADPADLSLYTAETIERGRLLAAVGDCAVCHTAPGGARNAGGLALETPFGVVYSTNLTPDPDTGLGRWSYTAFERAMREGISRDGHHLYPAFPYTAYTRMRDADLQALYAYLMSQPPVKAALPTTRLAFPFSVRPLMAVWNALFHRPGAYRDDPAQSQAWNRGAYLVEGPGHCSACHSPRNLFGAETGGAARWSGGVVEGWDAPALTGSTVGPAPWRIEDFYAYLRTGHSPRHGSALGPMSPVVDELAALPDADIHAMATYLASLSGPDAGAEAQAARIADAQGRAARIGAQIHSSTSRLYDGACAVCHEAQPLIDHYAPRPSLALSSAVHAARPDNLIRIIVQGSLVSAAAGRPGGMPSFASSLNDRQLSDLATYVRARFASDKPAWRDVGSLVRRVRLAGYSGARPRPPR